jgi:hypothetical protein
MLAYIAVVLPLESIGSEVTAWNEGWSECGRLGFCALTCRLQDHVGTDLHRGSETLGPKWYCTARTRTAQAQSSEQTLRRRTKKYSEAEMTLFLRLQVVKISS